MSKNAENIITKSLDDIDAIIEDIRKSKETEDNDIKKSEEPVITPEEISEDSPSMEEDTDEEGEEGMEEGEEGTEEGEEEEDDEDEDVEKSLEKELNSNENVRKALEVSEFLQELVKSFDKVVNDIRTSFTEGNTDITKSLGGSNDLLAKSLGGIVKSNKAILESNVELTKSVNSAMKRIEALENQPLVRKSVSNAKAMEKSFSESSGVGADNTNTLSKSQAVVKLTQAFEGGQSDLLGDVLALESTGDFNSISTQAKLILGIE